MNGLDSYGMFTSIASGGKVSIADILAYNGLGQSMYFTLAITNSTPFTLGDINLNFDSKFNSFSGTLNDFNQSYSLMGIGIGADGTVYSSGNANTPVVAAYIVGVGSSINTSGQPFPDAAISWSSVCPYDTTVSYTSGSLSTSALITVIGVPEPSTIALSALGAFGLILASRKGIK
jgi:hypothetical protein